MRVKENGGDRLARPGSRFRNRSRRGTQLLGLLIVAGTATAQEAPQPGCAAPEVPEQFVTKVEQDQFVSKARTFEQCMKAFIEEQRKTSELHAQAGNDAAAVFNRFAAAAADVKPPPEQ